MRKKNYGYSHRGRQKQRESTSDDFVGAFDGVRVKVLFARFGLGHEWLELGGFAFRSLGS